MTKINLGSLVRFKKFTKWHRRKKFIMLRILECSPPSENLDSCASAKTSPAPAYGTRVYVHPRGTRIYTRVVSTRGTRARAPVGARARLAAQGSA